MHDQTLKSTRCEISFLLRVYTKGVFNCFKCILKKSQISAKNKKDLLDLDKTHIHSFIDK